MADGNAIWRQANQDFNDALLGGAGEAELAAKKANLDQAVRIRDGLSPAMPQMPAKPAPQAAPAGSNIIERAIPTVRKLNQGLGGK